VAVLAHPSVGRVDGFAEEDRVVPESGERVPPGEGALKDDERFPGASRTWADDCRRTRHPATGPFTRLAAADPTVLATAARLGAPVGLATGFLLAYWLGRVAADRLTAHGPDLLLAMKTGRSVHPGASATAAGARPKRELTKREEVTAVLSWIFGGLALFPQGLVPLIFLFIGAEVKSWFLALYLPDAWSWVTVAVMISAGTALFAQAIRLSSGRTSRSTAQASPKDDAGQPDGDRAEYESA